MADVFNYPIRVSPAATTTHRTLKSPMGDGYSQVAPDGINTRIDSWNLGARGVWDAAPDACTPPGQPVRAIAQFINDHAGAEAFEWTAPDGLTAFWLCDGYSRDKDSPGLVTLSFTFYRTYFP